MPLTDLGIDPDTDLADQYPFTKTTASDQNGVQRGSTWQCCPGLAGLPARYCEGRLRHRRPRRDRREGQGLGHTQSRPLRSSRPRATSPSPPTPTPSVVYGNNVSQPWVTTGETTCQGGPADHGLDQRSSKEWLDAGYLDKTVKGQFNDDWNKAMGSASKVFAFLLPAVGHRLHPGPQLGRRRWQPGLCANPRR